MSTAQSFKSIGYIPYYRVHLVDSFAYDKLTHVNIAFANPDMEGNLSFGGTDVTPVITKAHDHGIKVFLSLAGGALTSEWAAAWKTLIKVENRDAFISKIILYAIANDYDGIDLDLEWSHVDENYSGFVLALKQQSDLHNFPLTAALPGTYRYPQITDQALAAFDWINMMVYDLRGPWDPTNAGPHSPLSFAHSSINYWEGQGVAKDKVTLGMPFYGYDFSDQNHVRALTYAQIIDRNPTNAYSDQDGDTYYNGIPTIEAKTQLALDDQLAGVMVWELGQDKFDEYSLLDKIGNIINANTSNVYQENNKDIKMFPNPFQDELVIEGEHAINGHLQIRDIHGRIIKEISIPAEIKTFRLTTNDLIVGQYIVGITTDNTSIYSILTKY